jgi:hypothetical protein
MLGNEKVLLVNTPFSHLHSFSAVGMSSGLATRVTSRQSRGRVGESVRRGWTFFWFNFFFRCTWLSWVAFWIVYYVFSNWQPGSQEGNELGAVNTAMSKKKQLWRVQLHIRRNWKYNTRYLSCTRPESNWWPLKLNLFHYSRRKRLGGEGGIAPTHSRPRH